MTILNRDTLDVEQQITVKGEYRLVKTAEDGTVVGDTGWFDNMILTSGLNRWGTGNVISGAAIGTGSTPPNAAQTALIAQSAWTTSSSAGTTDVSQTSAPYYTTSTISYRFGAGTLNGNYSEIGVGWASGSMFSRALIVDGTGTPTTITVGPTEALDVFYRIRMYLPTTDAVSTVNISGVNYTVTARTAYITTPSYSKAPVTGTIGTNAGYQTSAYSTSTLGPITAAPTGTYVNASNFTNLAYANNSMRRDVSHYWGLTEGNVSGGIGSLVAMLAGIALQVSFSPPIPKDGTKTLTLTFSTTWAAR